MSGVPLPRYSLHSYVVKNYTALLCVNYKKLYTFKTFTVVRYCV